MMVARRLLACRTLAALLCAAALLLKLLVPAGYMVASEHGRATIILCSGVAQPMVTMSPHHVGMPADHHRSDGHDKAATPCAFSGLSIAALGPPDPIRLAIAPVSRAPAWRAPATTPARPSRAHLRPPSRGPPEPRTT